MPKIKIPPKADHPDYYPPADFAAIEHRLHDPWVVTACAALVCGFDPTHPITYSGAGPHHALASQAIMAVKLGELKGQIVDDSVREDLYGPNGVTSAKREISYAMVRPMDFLEWYAQRPDAVVPGTLRKYLPVPLSPLQRLIVRVLPEVANPKKPAILRHLEQLPESRSVPMSEETFETHFDGLRDAGHVEYLNGAWRLTQKGDRERQKLF